MNTLPLDILHLILRRLPITSLDALSKCSSLLHRQVFTSDRSQKLWEHLYKRDYSEIRLPSDNNYLQAYRDAHVNFMNDYEIIFAKGYEKKFEQVWANRAGFNRMGKGRVLVSGSYRDWFIIVADHSHLDLVSRFLQLRGSFCPIEQTVINQALVKRNLGVIQVFLEERQLPLGTKLRVNIALNRLDEVKVVLEDPNSVELLYDKIDAIIEAAFYFHHQGIIRYLYDHADEINYAREGFLIQALVYDDFEFLEFYHRINPIDLDFALEPAFDNGSIRAIKWLQGKGAVLRNSVIEDLAYSVTSSNSEEVFRAFLELAGDRINPHVIIRNALLSSSKMALRYVRDRLDDPAWRNFDIHYAAPDETASLREYVDRLSE